MSQNTKKESYKKYLKLRKRQDEITKAQDNLGYVELETPIHHGYVAYFVLRDDIQNRADGEILAKLLEKYSSRPWCRNKNFINKRKKYTEIVEPKLQFLRDWEYAKLDPKTKEFFRVSWKKYWGGYEKGYSLDFPSYYLVIKKKKDYITHSKVIDGTLEAEDQFIDDQIQQIMYISSPYDEGSMKPYTKIKNKGERRNNKIRLKANIKNYDNFENYGYDLDMGLSYKHGNSAKWERW